MNRETRITVLGGRGFIGSHLVPHLHRLGYDCRSPERQDESIWTGPLGHVIYAIGLTADFRSKPLETVESHVCVLHRLIQAADLQSITYLSSTRVYVGGTDTSENASLQVNPSEPGDLYSLSKLMGESLCLHCGRQRMKVARLSNVVGLREDPDTFVDQLLEEGRRTGKVVFRSRLECKKDYVFIDDAVDLLARIAVSSESGIYNVAGGEGIENAEIASALAADMGFEVSVAPDALAWGFAPIDISKVKARFGFSPRGFRDYFPAFLRSYRKKKGI